MPFDDRISYLLFGMLIGFVLGRLTRLERMSKDIKEELDEVDEILNGEKHQKNKDEGGFIKTSRAGGFALLIVILLVAWASFASQRASNNSQDNQDRLETLVTCNSQILNRMVDATNDRTTYSAEQIKSNVDLQTSFSHLLAILLHQPPYGVARQSQAAVNYYSDLQNFLNVSKKSVIQVNRNPYPERDALAICVGDAAK
jgi:hypothetical protein